VVVEVLSPPDNGAVVVDGLEVVYTPIPGYVGPDTLVRAVTDGGTGDPRTGAPVTVEVEVPVTVNDGHPPGAGACGCRTTSPGGLAVLALLLCLRTRASRRA
jgi:hypothetical protein